MWFQKHNIFYKKIHASISFFYLTFALFHSPFSLGSSSGMGRGHDDVVFVQRSYDEGRSCWWQVTVGSTSPWLCPNTWGWSGGACLLHLEQCREKKKKKKKEANQHIDYCG